MPPSFVQSIKSMSFGTLFTASKLTWTTGHWKTLIFHLRTQASEVFLWQSKMMKFGNLLAKDFWKLFSRGFFSRKNASCIIHRPRLSTSLTRIVGEQVQHLPEKVTLIKFIDFTMLHNQQTTQLQPTSKPPWNPPFPSWIPTNQLPPLPPPFVGVPDRCAGTIFFEVHHGIHEIRCPMFLPWQKKTNVGNKRMMDTAIQINKKTKGWLGNWWWPSNISCTNDWLGTNFLWYRWLTWLVVFLV